MKHILCIIDSLGSGGAQRQIAGLARLLQEKNYNVTVIFWVRHDGDDFLEKALIRVGVTCDFQPKLRRTITRYSQLSKSITQLKPDVVVSYYDVVSEMLCIHHAFNTNSYQLIVSQRSMTRDLRIGTKIKFHLYRLADYIVPNSLTEGNFINKHFPFLRKKVHPICNFVDYSIFFPKVRILKDYKQVNAIFVGRVTAAKNIPNLLRAIGIVAQKKVPFHLDLYGRFQDEGLENVCRNIIKEKHIHDLVTFHPQTTEVAERYREHNLFIMASAWEGYPNVLCEAMSCGLPVICSKVSDIPFIMEEGKNGLLFDPQNIEEIANKITEYVQLPIETKYNMALKSHEIAQEKFQQERFVQQYINLIEQNVCSK